MIDDAIVFVVDDDPSVVRSLKRLLRVSGYRVEAFESAEQFLRCRIPDIPACLLLDVAMPGLSGLDLQAELARGGFCLPIIFLTGQADIRMTVCAMKAGASDFLTKPFNAGELLNAVESAIERDREAYRRRSEGAAAGERAGGLTPREREVLALVVIGLMNKQIAARLGVAEKTVKVHRARVMEKMRAQSVAELVRLADAAHISVAA